jgi:beta-xylosidase
MRNYRKLISTVLLLCCGSALLAQDHRRGDSEIPQRFNNPIITDKFTADPAAIVHEDNVYLYVGHDEAINDANFYDLNEWLVYSSEDMVNWQEHPVPLRATDFQWAVDDAWAAQVIQRNGKFYWYVTVHHDDSHPGKAIGVAVSDNPIGPFKDALGKALVTNDMTTEYTDISWDDIDPTVFIDDDGQAYLYWGNTQCYYVKLKDNMIELEGEIQTVDLPNFTEAPWIHKKGDWYYLSYAFGFPEKTAYAMSKSITGPWEYKGILNELAGNSNTNHQAIIEFKGTPYFIYHTGGISPDGGSFRRSVSVDRLYYNPDGTLKKVKMTSKGITKLKE